MEKTEKQILAKILELNNEKITNAKPYFDCNVKINVLMTIMKFMDEENKELTIEILDWLYEKDYEKRYPNMKKVDFSKFDGFIYDDKMWEYCGIENYAFLNIGKHFKKINDNVYLIDDKIKPYDKNDASIKKLTCSKEGCGWVRVKPEPPTEDIEDYTCYYCGSKMEEVIETIEFIVKDCSQCGKNALKQWSDKDFSECELCGYKTTTTTTN